MIYNILMGFAIYQHELTIGIHVSYVSYMLRVPWTARRPNQSILKEINSEYSLEGLRLKLKPPDVKSLFIRKGPDAGKD